MNDQSEKSKNQHITKAAHTEIVAERAYQILIKNIGKIKNVNHWAEMAGCSRSWLSRCIKARYNKTPNEVLREVRYDAILDCIKTNPDALAIFVASHVAPHWCEKRLNNFLSEYRKTSYTKLRYEVMKTRV